MRNRPTPVAPESTAACASSGSSMFAHEFDARAAERLRRRELQPLQLALLKRLFALPVRILLQHDRRRIDDHNAMIAVDDDQVVLADQRARMLHADRGRNAQAARDDRRMRGTSAEIGDETLKRLRFELHHVGRRDVVRDHDHLVAACRAHRRPSARRCAGERLQHALDHLLDVGFALAQVFVFDIVEMARQDARAVRSAPTRRYSGACGSDRWFPARAWHRSGSLNER